MPMCTCTEFFTFMRVRTCVRSRVCLLRVIDTFIPSSPLTLDDMHGPGNQVDPRHPPLPSPIPPGFCYESGIPIQQERGYLVCY